MSRRRKRILRAGHEKGTNMSMIRAGRGVLYKCAAYLYVCSCMGGRSRCRSRETGGAFPDVGSSPVALTPRADVVHRASPTEADCIARDAPCARARARRGRSCRASGRAADKRPGGVLHPLVDELLRPGALALAARGRAACGSRGRPCVPPARALAARRSQQRLPSAVPLVVPLGSRSVGR